jgi:hypothetical protein
VDLILKGDCGTQLNVAGRWGVPGSAFCLPTGRVAITCRNPDRILDPHRWSLVIRIRRNTTGPRIKNGCTPIPVVSFCSLESNGGGFSPPQASADRILVDDFYQFSDFEQYVRDWTAPY